MLETSRYIHLNPVKANMVEKPEEYKWSSFLMYIGGRKEEIINSEKILSYFKKGKQRQLYKAFVENGIKDKYEKEEPVLDGISSK